jgi:hypothetical protein
MGHGQIFKKIPLASFIESLALIRLLVLYAARSVEYREAPQTCQVKTGLQTLIQRLIIFDALVKKVKK